MAAAGSGVGERLGTVGRTRRLPGGDPVNWAVASGLVRSWEPLLADLNRDRAGLLLTETAQRTSLSQQRPHPLLALGDDIQHA